MTPAGLHRGVDQALVPFGQRLASLRPDMVEEAVLALPAVLGVQVVPAVLDRRDNRKTHFLTQIKTGFAFGAGVFPMVPDAVGKEVLLGHRGTALPEIVQEVAGFAQEAGLFPRVGGRDLAIADLIFKAFPICQQAVVIVHVADLADGLVGGGVRASKTPLGAT